eukprot:CAMPEP_0119271010 /NCGR_PEP_ID=MMETSP1329-20130426/7776_1 /TAXON_ID=114041 /ORGANISM="Genus nov. species nov., Strain RCC1024" /LENGTH=270 /DNA_ID=CAMNT_0007271049 /DNA_START=154 /DNA_END=963 /DNA_ORIENTATION=+
MTRLPRLVQRSLASSGTFYKRPLPENLPALSSPRGRELFAEAMARGGLKSYFALAETYATQSEPAFCGITTLSMSLNALGVDPGRRWKGVWRWYTDAMLETHVPLDQFERDGMSFDEFAGVARWNGAEARPRRAEDATLDCFRDAVRRACVDDDADTPEGAPLGDVLIASYNRSVLGQTGEGHFSPVAGLAPDSDMLLILDTARFKYPAHWVPTEALWRAMSDVNPWSGKSRGYVLLRPMPAQEEACPARFRAWSAPAVPEPGMHARACR